MSAAFDSRVPVSTAVLKVRSLTPGSPRHVYGTYGFIVSAHRLINITLLTLEQATLWFQRESPTYTLNEDTQPVIRAIGVSHTACKHEFRQNIRSHSWSVFLFI